MSKEAEIRINGVELTYAQSMTLRVAVTAFMERMADKNALGKDDHGRAMTASYYRCSGEILGIILAT